MIAESLQEEQATLHSLRRFVAIAAPTLLLLVGATLWLLLGLYGLVVWAAHHCREAWTGAVQPERPATTSLARGFYWGFGVMLLILAVLLSPGGKASLRRKTLPGAPCSPRSHPVAGATLGKRGGRQALGKLCRKRLYRVTVAAAAARRGRR